MSARTNGHTTTPSNSTLAVNFATRLNRHQVLKAGAGEGVVAGVAAMAGVEVEAQIRVVAGPRINREEEAGAVVAVNRPESSMGRY